MWELICESVHIGSRTERLKVPGGWLVKHANRSLGAETSAFIPDKNYTWNLKEETK